MSYLPRLLRPTPLLLVVALLLGAGSTPVAAQQRTDSAAVVLRTAADFTANGDHDVARALYRYIVETWPGTPAATSAADRLSTARAPEGSGATEIQVWSTLYGLWLGVGIPAALGADDEESYGLGLLLGGPAGFLAGRRVARARDYSIGQARAITLGGTWGAWQGFAWREILDWGIEEHCFELNCYQVDASDEETWTLMLLGSGVGLATGAMFAKSPITNATATAANFGSLYGSWFGVASGIVLGVEEDDVLYAMAALAGNAGLIAGAVAGSRLDWSRSRWRLVSVAALLGGLGGIGLDLIVDAREDEAIFGIPLATSAAGLAFGIWSTRDHDVVLPEGPETGAFLGYRDGSWSLQTPAPFPTLRPVFEPGRTRLAPALGIEFFRAVF